jgi:HdeA/HdeB family
MMRRPDRRYRSVAHLLARRENILLHSCDETNTLMFWAKNRIDRVRVKKTGRLLLGANMGHLSIRKFVWIAALLSAVMPTTGRAQVTINMSRVTCSDYLAMDTEQANVFGAWVGGYFNQKTGYTWIALEAERRNVANIKAWCATNPKEFVMTGIARAAETPAFEGDPARAVVKVEMTQITCREFIDYSFDKSEAIGAWMSGYWNAARNIETLDIARYKVNSKRVSAYCKNHKNAMLMATIQKVAR